MTSNPSKLEYNIDGEWMTRKQIRERVPNIPASTLRRRLNRGIRQWHGLLEDPDRAKARNADRFRKLLAAGNDKTAQDSSEQRRQAAIREAAKHRQRLGLSG